MKEKESPTKHSLEVQKTLDFIRDNSPDFKRKKFNNYDNTLRYMNRKVFDNMKVIQNVASTTFKDKQINFGHSVGPGGRAFMYVSQAKQDDDEEEKEVVVKSKFDFRRTQTNLL